MKSMLAFVMQMLELTGAEFAPAAPFLGCS